MSFEAPLGLATSNDPYAIEADIVSNQKLSHIKAKSKPAAAKAFLVRGYFSCKVVAVAYTCGLATGE
jgi:hypothetical protein